MADIIIIIDPIPFFDLAAAVGAAVVVGADDGVVDGDCVGRMAVGALVPFADIMDFDVDFDSVLDPAMPSPLS